MGEVALIVGGGPGTSASSARLFAREGMDVAIAARNPEKSALLDLEKEHGVRRFACDAGEADSVRKLFDDVSSELGSPRLVLHNIDGRVPEIFRKSVTEADPAVVHTVLRNSALSAFLVAQQAAAHMLRTEPEGDAHRGTILFTNASAALKGFAKSGAFAMACQAKRGLAESLARELGPQGIHVAHAPIDAAIGWTQADGTRKHWAAGETRDDNMADPDRIAEAYLQLHRQHRSTWAFEVVLRPWVERW